MLMVSALSPSASHFALTAALEYAALSRAADVRSIFR